MPALASIPINADDSDPEKAKATSTLRSSICEEAQEHEQDPGHPDNPAYIDIGISLAAFDCRNFGSLMPPEPPPSQHPGFEPLVFFQISSHLGNFVQQAFACILEPFTLVGGSGEVGGLVALPKFQK